MNPKKETQDDQSLERLHHVLDLLEKNLKYLEQLGMDVDSVSDYRKVLAYLKGRKPEEVVGIFSARSQAKKKQDKRPALTKEKIADLSSDQIRNLIFDESSSRADLELIASVRFSVTKGAISSLRNRDALVEKLGVMLRNEAAHASIARAVGAGVNSSANASKEDVGTSSAVQSDIFSEGASDKSASADSSKAVDSNHAKDVEPKA